VLNVEKNKNTKMKKRRGEFNVLKMRNIGQQKSKTRKKTRTENEERWGRK
jgi:hypothetical protein